MRPLNLKILFIIDPHHKLKQLNKMNSSYQQNFLRKQKDIIRKIQILMLRKLLLLTRKTFSLI